MRYRSSCLLLLALLPAASAQAQMHAEQGCTTCAQPPVMQAQAPYAAGSSGCAVPVYRPVDEFTPRKKNEACTASARCGACAGCVMPVQETHYLQVEGLMWWTKENSLPPLVTTSDPVPLIDDAGVLGLVGTGILFGDEDVNDDLRGGARATLGLWADDCLVNAGEITLFGLADETTDFSESSTGATILARPFFDVAAGAGSSAVIAFPGVAAGSIDIESRTQFLGAELNFRHGVACSTERRLDVLCGYRFTRLDESLRIDDESVIIDALDPDVGEATSRRDRFATENDFNGVNLGLLYKARHNRWTWALLSKVALGSVNQRVEIAGDTTVRTALGVETETEGGLLALGDNLGEFERDRFAVIPEVGVTFGYDLTPRLKATVGYTFIYFSNVVRPEDQIDLSINPSQLGGGPLIGPDAPQFEFADTDFWAQGANAGIEYRF